MRPAVKPMSVVRAIALSVLASLAPALAFGDTKGHEDGVSQSSSELSDLCVFAPPPALCAPLYQKALHSTAPDAQSIRAAYEGYARYLKDGPGLTDTDRKYLAANKIDVPNDLDALQLSGLHNVINDERFREKSEDRHDAAVNFITRAEEANIYCGFNSCRPDGGNRAEDKTQS
jgi:hypothetical protein